MSSVSYITKLVSPSFVAHEEDEYKLILYINIPGLRVQNVDKKYSKRTSSNGSHEFIEFKNRSFKFTTEIDDKLYSMSVACLPGFIIPQRCSMTYEDNGCWITLVKLKPISWMNTICDDLHPGLENSKGENRL